MQSHTSHLNVNKMFLFLSSSVNVNMGQWVIKNIHEKKIYADFSLSKFNLKLTLIEFT